MRCGPIRLKSSSLIYTYVCHFIKYLFRFIYEIKTMYTLNNDINVPLKMVKHQKPEQLLRFKSQGIGSHDMAFVLVFITRVGVYLVQIENASVRYTLASLMSCVRW